MFADQLSFEVLEVREYYIPILTFKRSMEVKKI